MVIVQKPTSLACPRICFFVFMMLFYPSMVGFCASAQTSIIQIDDGSGAPLPNALVIVKSLDRKEEIFRGLTNVHGKVSISPVKGKIFRIIASYPDSAFESAIIEATATEISRGITMSLAAEPSDKYGTFVIKPIGYHNNPSRCPRNIIKCKLISSRF